MLFKHIYDEDLAQASYLIGCQATGEAVVVDARRDVDTFINLATEHGLRITAVTETHIHADYQSGSRELAQRTGAKLYLSNEGNADWKYGFDGIKLQHGDTIQLGNVRLQAVHTPGHTPEHLAFLVTDGATSEQPGFYLTGDFVFVGDVGRPDLLDEAAGAEGTRFEGAERLFNSLRDQFLSLPDHVQVWPGHGAGSACGKALGAVASTTVGYERLTSWWAPLVIAGDKDTFVDALLEGQPDAPLYFGRMKRSNKAGPQLLGALAPLPELHPSELQTRAHEWVLLDTRSSDAHRANHVPNSYLAPDGKKFATYASYTIAPEVETRSLVLLARDTAHAHELRAKLHWTGIDRIVGFVTTLDGLTAGPAPQVRVHDVGHLQGAFLLDVRTKTEHAAGALTHAHQRHVGRVAYLHDDLPREQPIVVYCQAGTRAAVATPALRALGFHNVLEMTGSYDAYASWQTQRAPQTSSR